MLVKLTISLKLEENQEVCSFRKKGNEAKGRDRAYTHQEIQKVLRLLRSKN